MKPIQLELAGLQSFRQKQKIDFTRLCDAGVFGIFGPTGSGKSTILDAITLALYGRVERAQNGTQGIMNHAEQALSVSFVFELASPEGAQRYKVERQYKRTNEVSIASTVSRLIYQSPDGDQVLADKQGEVNASVEQLLGLSMNDFTRAVVLPQGKFAEFLSLKGGERRQMLQRLFRLEQYGDELLTRLSEQVRTSDSALKQLQAEQQGLGDASKEALEAAEQHLGEVRKLAAEQRERAATAEKAASEARRYLDLLLEREDVEKQLLQLQENAQSHANLERQLEWAARAQALRPYLEQFEHAQEEKERTAALYQQTEIQHQLIYTTTQHIQQRYELAVKECEMKEPELIIQLERYKDAVVIEQQIQEAGERLAHFKKSLAMQNDQLKNITAQTESQQKLLHRAQQRQTELKLELQKVEVPLELRKRMQEALRAQQTIQFAQQQAEMNTRAIADRKTIHTQISKQFDELEREQRQRLAERLQSQASLHTLYEELVLVEKGSELLQLRLPELLKQAQVAAQAQQRQRLALELSVQLEAGNACYVCGSLEHPEPAYKHSPELQPRLEGVEEGSLVEQLSEARNAASELVYAIRTLKRDAVSISDQFHLESTVPLEGEAAVGLEEHSTEEHEKHEHERQTMTGLDVIERVQIYTERIPVLEAEMKRVRKSAEAWRQRYEVLLSQRQALEAEQAAANQWMDQLKHKSEELSIASRAAQESYEASFPDLPLPELEHRAQQLDDRDQQAEELRVRLEKSVAFIEEEQHRLQRMQQEHANLEKEQIRIELEQEALQFQLKEQQANFVKLVGEASAEPLVEGTQAALDQIRHAVKQAKQQHEEAYRQLEQIGQQLSAAKQAFISAEASWEQAHKQWSLVFESAPFQTRDEVKGAYASPEEMQRWQAQIQAHRDAEKQWTSEWNRLSQFIGEHKVTTEQWEELDELRQAAQQALEIAWSDQAKAERDVEELFRKHERWSEIEAERRSQELKLAQYHKLQSVFRGNRFVEFLSEEQLLQVCRMASERLGMLTRQRYALEVDSEGGFVIRDDANGGVRRPVGTLSGGETFLTSLALALALSAQIQLRGKYPLEFFFLDEGFGTLDPDLLETVVAALEKLHMDQLTVGVISHVPELRERLPRRLVVQPSQGELGSMVFHADL